MPPPHIWEPCVKGRLHSKYLSTALKRHNVLILQGIRQCVLPFYENELF